MPVKLLRRPSRHKARPPPAGPAVPVAYWSVPAGQVRTRGPFWRSRLGTLLLVTTFAVIAVALALPYLPFSGAFGFVPLPAPLLLTMIGLTVVYVVAVEAGKKWFYARVAEANR